MRMKVVFCGALIVAMVGCDSCQDGGKEKGGKEESAIGAEAPTCERDFVGQRQKGVWYGSHDFVDQVACKSPKKKTIHETVSLPVYYVDIGANWTAAQASTKMDEAKTWFKQYCITLQVHDVPLRAQEKQVLAKILSDGDTGKAEYRKAVGDVYLRLWTLRMGRPRDFVLILFVDNFGAVDYGDARVNNVTGNFDTIPLVLVTAHDQAATNIVTHELVHAFGKELGKSTSNPPNSLLSCSGERDNTWSEAPCDNDMGNPKRPGGPAGPFNNPNGDIIDWASYYDFHRCKAIR
jgi:hypothetical protein